MELKAMAEKIVDTARTVGAFGALGVSIIGAYTLVASLTAFGVLAGVSGGGGIGYLRLWTFHPFETFRKEMTGDEAE